MKAGRDALFKLWMEPIFWVMVGHFVDNIPGYDVLFVNLSTSEPSILTLLHATEISAHLE